MTENRRPATATIIAAVMLFDAVALLNGVYLWDLIVDKHDGWILLGWKAYLGIAIANLGVIGALAWLFARAMRPRQPSPSSG